MAFQMVSHIHSFFRSFIRLPIHSFARPFIHSLAHSFIRSLAVHSYKPTYPISGADRSSCSVYPARPANRSGGQRGFSGVNGGVWACV